jgi:hypothetical protein
LLVDNSKVPFRDSSLSTPAPSFQGVPSVAFLLAGGASGSQSFPFASRKSLFLPSLLEFFSYPQLEDNSLVSPIKSISLMETDPPNLPPSLHADQASPIVGRALGFDTDSVAHRMQPCVYPRVKDTCIVEHRPAADAAIEDAPLGSGMAESEDATKIECALPNASIGGCKDVLPVLRSSDDDEDEGGQEHHGDG